MADLISLTQLANASTDAQTLADAINGNEQLDVISRLGAKYPTLAKAIKTIMQKAPINSTPFATKSALIADTTLADGSFAFVYNDLDIKNNGVYYKKNGVWSNASYDVLRDRYIKNTIGLKSGANIADLNKFTDNKYYNYTNGALYDNAGYVALGLYDVESNAVYRVPNWYNQQYAFFDINKNFVSGQPNPSADHKITVPSNVAYIGLSIPKSQKSDFMFAKLAEYPSSFEPFYTTLESLKLQSSQIVGLDDAIMSAVNYNEIFVSADLNDTDTLVKFKGKNAIQQAIDSITDASATNRYKIIAKAGLYKITQANEFIGLPGYPAMICMKDFIDVAGQGIDNTVIWAELPYNDAAIGASIDGNTYDRTRYQTVYNYADATMQDLTLVAVNLRYSVHQDSELGVNKNHNYKNVGFIFKGDKGILNPLGIGTFSGEQTYVNGGKSISDYGYAYACHNNVAFNKPSIWSFTNHHFANLWRSGAIYMQNDGSLLQDKLELVGCSFGGASYAIVYDDIWLDGDTSKNHDSFNHAEWLVTGYGNEPFLFDNVIKNGLSLRIKSKTTGASSTVRFDKSSSAYPILIKNNHNYAPLHTNKYEYIDGYIAQNGSANISGLAIGCLDVSESAYAYNGGTIYTSLAKRLGNLSSSVKSLVVIVDGTTNTINFNKDYSSMTNAQILADINAQLTNATADFYNYGRDYYPIMTDVSECVYNNGSTYIAKGSLVTKQAGFVKLANGNDKVYGVALDDIPVMSVTADGVRKGQGRVLKRGYIYADKSKAHFVLADNQSPGIGTRFAVSNGQLVTDSNGKISVDIDSGVISINC